MKSKTGFSGFFSCPRGYSHVLHNSLCGLKGAGQEDIDVSSEPSPWCKSSSRGIVLVQIFQPVQSSSQLILQHMTSTSNLSVGTIH